MQKKLLCFISRQSFFQFLMIGLLVNLLFACSSSTPRRDLKRYVPAVASSKLKPSAAVSKPTNLSKLAPTKKIKPRVMQQPTVDLQALRKTILKDERSIFFSYNGSMVNTNYQRLLSSISNEVNYNRITALRVEGNTDRRGSRSYNLALGKRRANSVRNALVAVGVPSNIISTVSYGEEKPLAPGNDDESYAINRRVDILYAGEY